MNKQDALLSEKIDFLLEGKLGSASTDIRISSMDGVIELSGFVDILAEKNTIQTLVSRVPGVKKVQNDLTIATDGTVRDKEIAQNVNQKLRDSEYSEELIGVSAKVSKGTAILEGAVSTQKYRRTAIEEASKAFGVKTIVSHMHLSSHSSDITIVNTLNSLLTTQRIDTTDLVLKVHDGSITLEGYVSDMKQMENLITIAESVPGVRNISNSLSFKPKYMQ